MTKIVRLLPEGLYGKRANPHKDTGRKPQHADPSRSVEPLVDTTPVSSAKSIGKLAVGTATVLGLARNRLKPSTAGRFAAVFLTGIAISSVVGAVQHDIEARNAAGTADRTAEAAAALGWGPDVQEQEIHELNKAANYDLQSANEYYSAGADALDASVLGAGALVLGAYSSRRRNREALGPAPDDPAVAGRDLAASIWGVLRGNGRRQALPVSPEQLPPSDWPDLPAPEHLE